MTLRDCERMFSAIALTAEDLTRSTADRVVSVSVLAALAESCLRDARERRAKP